jgi:chloramphenicol-sensitive protein RarD
MVPGIAYAAWRWHSGGGVFGRTSSGTLLMMLAGPVTVAPLALFSWTARRLPLSVIGFLQFISPTMGFALGAWLHEPLTRLRLVSFGFIWTGVAVFAAGSWFAARPRRAISSGSDPA